MIVASESPQFAKVGTSWGQVHEAHCISTTKQYFQILLISEIAPVTTGRARKAAMRIANSIFASNLKGKRQFRTPTYKWADNIKMYV